MQNLLFDAMDIIERRRKTPSQQAAGEVAVVLDEVMGHGGADTPIRRGGGDVMPDRMPQHPSASPEGMPEAGSSGGMLNGAMGGLNAAFAKLPGRQDVQHHSMFIDDKPIVLPQYRRGGLLRGAGEVHDGEVVIADEALVIPKEQAERLVTRTPDGELEIDARQQYGGDEADMPRPTRQEQYGNPVTDGRPTRGEQYGLGQTEKGLVIPPAEGQPPAIELTPRERELADLDAEDKALQTQAKDAMVVKKEKYKDFFYGMLQGLNNALNNRNDQVKSWGEKKRDDRLAEIAPKIQLIKQRKAEIAASEKAETEQMKARADAYKARIQAIQAQNPKLWEAIEKKGYIDKADQQAIAAAGYGYIPEGDWRQFDTMYDKDGNLLYSPKTGKPNYQATGIQDPKQGTAVFDGYPMKPAEAGRLKVDQEQFNATKTQDITKENEDNRLKVEMENIKNEQNYATKRLDVLKSIANVEMNLPNSDEIAGLQGKLDEINSRYTQAKTADEAETLRKEFDEATQALTTAYKQSGVGRKAVADMQKALNAIPKPKRIEYKPLQPSTVGGKVSSMADVEAFAKSKGWTVEQAKRYVQNNGWTIR